MERRLILTDRQTSTTDRPTDEPTGGRELTSTERRKVYDNGTLIVSEASRELDEGIYVCRAVNQKGDSSSGNLHIQVLSKSQAGVS